MTSLPRLHICQLLEKSPRIRKILDTESIDFAVQIHPKLHQCLGTQSVKDFDFLLKMPCEVVSMAIDDDIFLQNMLDIKPDKDKILAKFLR